MTMIALWRTHARTLALVLTVFGLAVLVQARLVIALKGNLAVVKIAAYSVENVRPLAVKDLVIDQHRPALNNCESVLTDLRDLTADNQAPQLIRALGISQAVCGQPQQAERSLRAVGSDSLALMAMAIVISEQGRAAEALQVVRQVPGAASMLAINGESAYWVGQRDEALALLEMSLAIDSVPNPGKAELYHHLSILHEEKNHPDEAIRYARLWGDVAPTNQDASMLLAGLYLRRGRAEDAFPVLQRAEALGAASHPQFPGLMGRVYDLRGNLERAIPLYREAVTRNPDDVYARWFLGQALYHHGDNQEALFHLGLVARSIYPSLQQAAEGLLTQINKEIGRNNP